MSDAALPVFIEDPDPEHPGWVSWRLSDETRFNAQVMGKMLIRRDEEGRACTRMVPEHRHTNLAGAVHGGIILSLIDVSLFSGARLYGVSMAAAAVTLDLSTQFIDAAGPDVPLDSIVELLRETRRLIFLRGVVEQEGRLIAAFSGTVRKPPAPAP